MTYLLLSSCLPASLLLLALWCPRGIQVLLHVPWSGLPAAGEVYQHLGSLNLFCCRYFFSLANLASIAVNLASPSALMFLIVVFIPVSWALTVCSMISFVRFTIDPFCSVEVPAASVPSCHSFFLRRCLFIFSRAL